MRPTHVNSLRDPEQQVEADLSTMRYDRMMAENKRIGEAKRRARTAPVVMDRTAFQELIARSAPGKFERRGMSDYQKLVKMHGSVAEAEKRIAQYISDKRAAIALPALSDLEAARDRRLRMIQTIL